MFFDDIYTYTTAFLQMINGTGKYNPLYIGWSKKVIPLF